MSVVMKIVRRFVHKQRLEYLKDLTQAGNTKNFTVIQLPQSIDYHEGEKSLKEDDAYMMKIDPGSFVLMTRQRDSYDFAKVCDACPSRS